MVPSGTRPADERGRGPAPRGILVPRTLANSHPDLLRVLAPGTSVLDVGSGPGTLTAEIARRVAPARVVGVDLNPEMVELARAEHPRAALPNLAFRAGDILTARWPGAFDVVTASRTLSWIADVPRALGRMTRAAAPGGAVVVLDVDHAATEWAGPPRPWVRFVRGFLEWRSAAGLDNALASRLGGLLRCAGLAGVTVTRRPITVRAGDFFRLAGAWRVLAESRGRQMVAAGTLTERERAAAVAAFTAWMQAPGAAQTTCEACAIGRRLRAT
jgi:SAM-dependent methyltransferase